MYAFVNHKGRLDCRVERRIQIPVKDMKPFFFTLQLLVNSKILFDLPALVVNQHENLNRFKIIYLNYTLSTFFSNREC